MIEVTNLVVGFLLGTVCTIALAFPRIGRIAARVVAVVSLGAGTGLLVWAIMAATRSEALRPVVWQAFNITETSEAFGWAAGLLAAGAAALTLSFIGKSRSAI
jgi:hypothetical protein